MEKKDGGTSLEIFHAFEDIPAGYQIVSIGKKVDTTAWQEYSYACSIGLKSPDPIQRPVYYCRRELSKTSKV